MDCSLPGSSVQGIFQAIILDGLPFSSPGDLPNAGIKPGFPASPALAGGLLLLSSGSPWQWRSCLISLPSGAISFQSSRTVPASQVADTLGEFQSVSPVPSSRIWNHWSLFGAEEAHSSPFRILNWRNHELLFWRTTTVMPALRHLFLLCARCCFKHFT